MRFFILSLISLLDFSGIHRIYGNGGLKHIASFRCIKCVVNIYVKEFLMLSHTLSNQSSAHPLHVTVDEVWIPKLKVNVSRRLKKKITFKELYNFSVGNELCIRISVTKNHSRNNNRQSYAPKAIIPYLEWMCVQKLNYNYDWYKVWTF